MADDGQLEGRLEDFEQPYESPEHRQIGRLLDYCGIPFLYRQPVLVHDGRAYRNMQPAFLLPSHNGTIVEYLSDPESVPDLQEIWRRETTYRLNAVTAAFVYPHDLDEPGRVLTKIAKAYRNVDST